MFQLEKSKNGMLTLKYNGKYIHSKYDPQKEAEQFAKANIHLIKNRKSVVVYGIGLGYHIIEIIKLMDMKSKLFVFENSSELVEYSKKINETVFDQDNVEVITNMDEQFYNKFEKCIDLSGGIIIHKPSLEVIQSTNEKLYYLINDFNLRIQFYNANAEKMELYEMNFIENVNCNYTIIDDLIKKMRTINKPFVVVAAGPSLDCEVELLKGFRNDFIIITVGSAVRTLVNNGVFPDVIVIVDGNERVKEQIKGLEGKGIPLCYEASASRWAVRSYNGNKYIFGERIKENKIKIESSSTVAVSAIDIAVKSNSKEIILLGQDLAYLGEKSHAGAYEETYGYKDNEKSALKINKVESVTGNTIETSDNYLLFKRKIEALIEKNMEVKFINCSHGVKIKGTINEKFSKYLEK